LPPPAPGIAAILKAKIALPPALYPSQLPLSLSPPFLSPSRFITSFTL
jgi:hypothetical protein